MIYTTAEGIKRVDKVPYNNKIELRKFTPEEKRRMEEIIFYVLLNQMHESGAASQPMGTSQPEMLAAILGLRSGVIKHAYLTLTEPDKKPTTDEICLTLKVYGVPAAKSMFTAETYYKGLRRWVQAGRPVIEPKLAALQHKEIIKFINGYKKAFLGKRNVSATLLK